MKVLDRLRQLGPVFSLNDLVRLGLKRETAHKTVMRWEDQDLIKQAGPRAAVYYNLLVDRYGPLNRKLEAAQLLYPSAVVVGAAVLHAHGWTTQIPQSLDVAILRRATVKQIDGVHLVHRDADWYASQHDTLLLPGKDSPFSIASLAPRQALADAREHDDVWRPDDDDLDIPPDDDDSPGERPRGG